MDCSFKKYYQGFRKKVTPVGILNLLFLLFFIPSGLEVFGQSDQGIRVGLSLQIGTHVQRIGFMYSLFYYNPSIQVSQSTWLHYNRKNFGPNERSFELKLHGGIQYHWNSNPRSMYMFNENSNLSPYLNSVGYSFYWYLDGVETSQTTGALYGSTGGFQGVIANDALGLNQIDDKFRTGAVYFGYSVDSTLIGIQSTLWTGKSAGSPRIADTSYPSRFGYRDVSDSKFGDLSHGILAARVETFLPFQQVARAEVGIDAERIRHALQNKAIHDGLSKRLMTSENPHYPMLQQDGSIFKFKEGEKVKKVKPYVQIGANQPTFY